MRGKRERIENKKSVGSSKISFQIFLGSLVFGRIVNLISLFPAYVGGDSISYRPIGVPPTSIPSLSYWPETLWGKGTRGLLPVGFFHFLPSDELRMIGQSLISILAWALLGWIVFQLRSSNLVSEKIYRFLLLFICLFSLCGEVTSWNKIIYSESLAISFFVISIALLLRILYFAQLRKIIMVLWVFANFLLVTARPNFILVFVTVIIFLFYKNYLGAFRSTFFTTLAIFSLITSYSYEKSNSDLWTTHNWSHELVAISYYASADNPHADSFVPLVNESPGKPICVPKLTGPLPSDQQLLWSLPFNFNNTCIAARQWSQGAFWPMVFKWWHNSPKDAADTYRRALIAASRQLPYFDQVVPVPAIISNSIFPFTDAQITLPDSYHSGSDRQPKVSFDPIVIYILVAFFAWFAGRKRKSFNNPTKPPTSLLGVLIAYIVGSVLMLISGILLTPGPQREVYRHAVVPFISLRLLIGIFAIINAVNLYETTKISNLTEKKSLL
jgi:hypothetical protein